MLQLSQLQMLGVIWGLSPCSWCYLFKPGFEEGAVD